MPDDDAREKHKAKLREEREQRTVELFKTSSKGLRRVFEKHFPDLNGQVEKLVFHLAQVEARMPTTNEAIRLARYPGAGDRDPRRMAMGLWENLSVLETHLRKAKDSLESLARGSREAADAAEDDDE